MTESPLRRLPEFGQSSWLDFIQRGLIESGELARLIERWGLRGITSNPTIFEHAIAKTGDYDAEIARLAVLGRNAVEIYEELALADVRAPATSTVTSSECKGDEIAEQLFGPSRCRVSPASACSPVDDTPRWDSSQRSLQVVASVFRVRAFEKSVAGTDRLAELLRLCEAVCRTRQRFGSEGRCYHERLRRAAHIST